MITLPYFIVRREIKSISHYRIRESSRSLTGYVCECFFEDRRKAHAFAAKWAKRLPEVCKGVIVRRKGAEFAASVPCAWSGEPF